MHWILASERNRSGPHVPDAEGRGRWAVLQFFTCQACWVWLHFSFNSGHTCPKIHELKHSKVNSVSSSVHESPCCFLFIREKKRRSQLYSVLGIPMTGERDLCASFKSKGKPSCLRSHTVGQGEGGRAVPARGGGIQGLQSSRSKKSKQKFTLMNWPG